MSRVDRTIVVMLRVDTVICYLGFINYICRKVSRIDWLIDGLASKDRDIRKQAITELRALAGQDFGFRVDDNPKQRDAATQAVARWWTERKRAMGW